MTNNGDAWHRATAERVGTAIAKARKAAGLSAQGLAERCAKLGAPIHRVTISKIENGRGRFDLGEWLILARALDVPPMALLFPALPDGEVEALPGVTQTSWEAYRWATGMDGASATPTAPARLVRACLKRDTVAPDSRGEPSFIGRATLEALETRNSALLRELEQLASRKRAELDEINQTIREAGGILQANESGVDRTTPQDGMG